MTGKKYKSSIIGPSGRPQSISLVDKWAYQRDCKENTLARDEIYQMYVILGEDYPNKRADDLFFRSNSDGDTTISCEEFVEIYMKELEEKEKLRAKLAENILRFRRRVSHGMCSFMARLFRSQTQRVVAQKRLDDFQKSKLERELSELNEFANQLTREQSKTSLVLGNTVDIKVDDDDELEKIMRFYKQYGRERTPQDDGSEFRDFELTQHQTAPHERNDTENSLMQLVSG